MVIKKSRKQYSKTFKTSFIDSYKNQELNLYSYCLKVNVVYDCANRWTKAVNIPNRSTKSRPTSKSEQSIVIQKFMNSNNCSGGLSLVIFANRKGISLTQFAFASNNTWHL